MEQNPSFNDATPILSQEKHAPASLLKIASPVAFLMGVALASQFKIDPHFITRILNVKNGDVLMLDDFSLKHEGNSKPFDFTQGHEALEWFKIAFQRVFP